MYGMGANAALAGSGPAAVAALAASADCATLVRERSEPAVAPASRDRRVSFIFRSREAPIVQSLLFQCDTQKLPHGARAHLASLIALERRVPRGQRYHYHAIERQARVLQCISRRQNGNSEIVVASEEQHARLLLLRHERGDILRGIAIELGLRPHAGGRRATPVPAPVHVQRE